MLFAERLIAFALRAHWECVSTFSHVTRKHFYALQRPGNLDGHQKHVISKRVLTTISLQPGRRVEVLTRCPPHTQSYQVRYRTPEWQWAHAAVSSSIILHHSLVVDGALYGRSSRLRRRTAIEKPAREEACAHHVLTGNARNAAHTSDMEDSSHSLTTPFLLVTPNMASMIDCLTSQPPTRL
jgi:hypothetical protein